MDACTQLTGNCSEKRCTYTEHEGGGHISNAACQSHIYLDMPVQLAESLDVCSEACRCQQYTLSKYNTTPVWGFKRGQSSSALQALTSSSCLAPHGGAHHGGYIGDFGSHLASIPITMSWILNVVRIKVIFDSSRIMPVAWSLSRKCLELCRRICSF